VSGFWTDEDLAFTLLLVCICGRIGVKGKVDLSDHTRSMFAKGYPLEISLSSVSKGNGYLKDFLKPGTL
jgi:hypothetical protein